MYDVKETHYIRNLNALVKECKRMAEVNANRIFYLNSFVYNYYVGLHPLSIYYLPKQHFSKVVSTRLGLRLYWPRGQKDMALVLTPVT
jgi:hypothetical protein